MNQVVLPYLAVFNRALQPGDENFIDWATATQHVMVNKIKKKSRIHFCIVELQRKKIKHLTSIKFRSDNGEMDMQIIKKKKTEKVIVN